MRVECVGRMQVRTEEKGEAEVYVVVKKKNESSRAGGSNGMVK